MHKTKCLVCGKEVIRRGAKPGSFCSMECKSAHQRTAKPVTREWLERQYVELGMSCEAIAKIVKRDPKRVYEWLVDLKIPTRARGWSTEPNPAEKPYQNKSWLSVEYLLKGRSAKEIAEQFGVDQNNIFHFLKKLKVPSRGMSEIRSIKKWAATGEANGMFGRRGESNPNWKGGCSPERQACYSSNAWINVAKKVRRRDKQRCQKCGEREELEIHHIVSFAVKELRCVASNLVLLCSSCHDFVHSRDNTRKEFLFDG